MEVINNALGEMPDSMGVQLGRTDDVSVHRTESWREPRT